VKWRPNGDKKKDEEEEKKAATVLPSGENEWRENQWTAFVIKNY